MIWRITYAHVEIWQFCLDHISKHDFQSLSFGLPLHALRDFGRHPRIKLDCYNPLCSFEYFDCDISGSGANLKDDLALSVDIVFA